MCEVHKTSREQEIAHGCALTVLTDWVRVKQLQLPNFQKVAAEAFGTSHARYDLLATRWPASKLLDPESRKLIMSDIGIAIGLHGAEDLLISTSEVYLPILSKSREYGGVRFPNNLRVYDHSAEFFPKANVPIIVTCMDWRLHGSTRLAELVLETYGYDDFYVMTVPGVGKDLLDTSSDRFGMVASQLFEHAFGYAATVKVELLGHTDCGKYGGSRAFANSAAERQNLSNDLTQASRNLESEVPGLKVGIGIVQLSANQPQGITIGVQE